MYASLLLPLLLVLAAPVPEFKLTWEEEAAIKALEPFGIRFLQRGNDKKYPYGTILRYHPNLGYDRENGKIIRAPMPSAKELAPLAKLTRLRTIEFSGAPIVNDTMLGLLRDMSQLRALDLRKTKVMDEGLKKLGGLKKLRFLALDDTHITDDGLKTLADFPALFELWLNRTRVTDGGLKTLDKNEHLRILHLGENQDLGDECIASLATMPNLLTIWLNRTRVTDEGLARMAKPGTYPKLSSLRLSDTIISGNGLQILHNPKVLPSLKRIALDGSNVTEKDIKALKKARPGLEIIVK